MGKSGLIARPVAAARTRHRLAPSRISESYMRLGRVLMPAYLRVALSFKKIEIKNPEKLVEPIRDFQNRKSRLIVAFRHPYGDEPQLMFHVFENLVPRYARKLNKPLEKRTHIRLIHDYAVPLWGGAFIRFILPHAGALPIYHIKADSASLKNIRYALSNDPCVIGLAPEGQISYHSETLPRIEQGTIRMGFWCASDLKKASRSEKVVVLPLSVHYRYSEKDYKKIMRGIARLEAFCGLVPRRAETSPEDLPSRIDAIESRILDIIEGYYAQLRIQASGI